MLHFHGTPISPIETLYELRGRFFCVSHEKPAQIKHVHAIGQGVMIDNGAYSVWTRGARPRWQMFYEWTEYWLQYPCTWAVVPDAIDQPSQENDALLNEWPNGKDRAAPVWHMDEGVYRLHRLIEDGWSRVCIGSTGEYAQVMSDSWQAKMDSIWDGLARTFGRTPAIHMLRGLQCSGKRWPFASADSTVVAQSHKTSDRTALSLAARLDGEQCPGFWTPRGEQEELF